MTGPEIVPARKYFAGMNSHEAVIARYGVETQADAAERRAREQRQADAADLAAQQSALVALGLRDEPLTHAQVIARAAAHGAVQDEREVAQQAREGRDDRLGEPDGRPRPWELRAAQEQREREAAATAATQADLGALQRQLTKVKSMLLGRK